MTCKKTGIRYCLGYGGLLPRKWGYTLKVAVKRHASRATKEGIARFRRNMQARIKRCRRNRMPVPIQDEVVFVADAKPRQVYAPPEVRAVTCVTGTHERTVVYGVLGLNGEQLFCQLMKKWHPPSRCRHDIIHNLRPDGKYATTLAYPSAHYSDMRCNIRAGSIIGAGPVGPPCRPTRQLR